MLHHFARHRIDPAAVCGMQFTGICDHRLQTVKQFADQKIHRIVSFQLKMEHTDTLSAQIVDDVLTLLGQITELGHGADVAIEGRTIRGKAVGYTYVDAEWQGRTLQFPVIVYPADVNLAEDNLAVVGFKPIYTDYFLKNITLINDDAIYYFEHYLNDCCKAWEKDGGKWKEFWLPILICGQSGTSGTEYKISYIMYIKQITRYIMHKCGFHRF